MRDVPDRGRLGWMRRGKSPVPSMVTGSKQGVDMRIMRKLMLLALMAAAALAFTAPSASALEVEIENGVHCTAVEIIDHGEGSGGCTVHATSEAQVELGSPLGMTLCDNEFEARVDENGEGFIYSQLLTNCSPLPVIPCSEAGVNDNWEVHLKSETLMEAQFCVDVLGLEINCHLDNIHIGEPEPHQYEFFTEGHQPCEFPFNDSSVEGHWVAETTEHPELEIKH
jgi:hypothetical protein